MSKNDKDVNVNVGGGFFGLLGLAFIILKLTHVISWSWLWVLAPLWIGLAIWLVVVIVIIIVAVIAGR